MIDKKEIEDLGFTHLGSRWWKNEDDSIRIRQWKGNEIDIYRWINDEDNQIHFRGVLIDINELKWVLERI